MEDIKRRLDLRSPSIKSQAFKRVTEQILRRKGDDPITETTPKIAEFEFLWEKCGDADLSVCHGACRSLQLLVTHHRCADYHYTLRRLLNAAPSAQNASGIVKAVTDLLVFEVLVTSRESQCYASPYSIRAHAHPFITLVTHRADCWPLLLAHANRVLTWADATVRENAIELLEPFFKFVLLEPNQSMQFSQLRSSLVGSTLQVTSRDAQTQHCLITWYLRHVPLLQLKNSSSVGEATLYLQTVAHHIPGHGGTLGQHTPGQGGDHDGLASRLVLGAFDICQACLRQDVDMTAVVHIIDVIGSCHPESLRMPAVVAHVCGLMYGAPPHDNTALLRILGHNIQLQEGKSPGEINAVLYGCCIQPLLSCVMAAGDLDEDTVSARNNASRVLKLLEAVIERASDADRGTGEDAVIGTCASVNSYTIRYVVEVSRKLTGCPPASRAWLEGVAQLLTSKSPALSSQFVCLLCGVFCVSRDDGVIQTSLGIFRQIAKLDQAQSLLLLPVLLYKLNKTESPRSRLSILSTVPCIAANKASMTLILRTLQHLGGSPSVKALSLRLVSSLWQHQDRCFPYLQQMLSEKDYGGVCEESGVDEVALARAACIRDVCRIRPHQHGEDMVAPISNILEVMTSEKDAPVVSLALDGLFHLCQAEVIDVKTAWSVLEAKLSRDQRPLAVKGVCSLLSLVPSLATGHPSYQKFVSDVVELLWLHANSHDADPLIVTSAFRALASFPPDSFQLKHLPKQVTGEILADALAAAEDQAEEEAGEVVLPPITGECYTGLLKILPLTAMSGYEEFLESLVAHEVTNLPRGIHLSVSRRQQSAAGHNKALAAIPQYLAAEYERNRQPGIRPALAVGLLFGYDPQPEVGRDGKPRRNHVAQHGRQYQRMLYTLINEVPIQPSEWYRCVYVAGAWTAFMERCYGAYVQSRVAELQLRLHSGEETSPEENQLQQDTAWLWARDKLLDLIKSSSRGSPSMQGNSMCALAGLAVASCKYAASLDEAAMARTEHVPEHMSQGHWLGMACATLLAVVDVAYVPPGRIFTMCGQHSEAERTPASLLARSSAAVSLSQLIAPLISLNADFVYGILSVLTKHLPGFVDKPHEGQEAGSRVGERSEEPGVVQFHYGLGLGWVICCLFEEKFLDVTGSQGMIAVWKAIGDLEASAFSQSDNRLGSLLGLSVALSGMSKDGKPDSKVHISGLHEKLATLLHTLQPTDSAYDGACLCLASTTASSYAANILPQASVDQSVATIYQAHVNNPQNQGACAALGSVCYGLLMADHPTVKDLATKLFAGWLAQLQDSGVGVMDKVATLLGATTVAGICNTVLQMDNTKQIGKLIDQSELISTLKTLQAEPEVGVSSACPWLLGQLYLSSFDVTDSKSSVPSSYNYLEDTSVLKAIVQLILEAGKQGPEVMDGRLVTVALRALVQGTSQTLPPVNWASLFSPLMRMSYGDEIECLCLQMAVKQSQGSPSAAMFVTSWLLSPLYDSLTVRSHRQLFNCLPTLIKTVPLTKLESYLSQHLVALFRTPVHDGNKETCLHALWGVLGALKINDPPQSVTLLLYQTVEKLYQAPAVRQHNEFACVVCECLRELPDSVVDRITGDDFGSHNAPGKENLSRDAVEHGVWTRCYLVGCGSQPLAWINPAIEAAIRVDSERQTWSAQCVLRSLLSVTSCHGDNASPSQQSGWLLELMGHTRNVAMGIVDLAHTSNPLSQTVQFMLGVLSAAVIAFNQSDHHILIGTSAMATPRTVPAPHLSAPTDNPAMCTENDPDFMKSLFCILPSALHDLLQVEPWKQMTLKVIDWLLTLLSAPCLKEDWPMKTLLQACVYSLRHSKDFQKMTTWSRVYATEQ